MVQTPLGDFAWRTAYLDRKVHHHQLMLGVDQHGRTAGTTMLEHSRRHEGGGVDRLLLELDAPTVAPASLVELLRAIDRTEPGDLIPGHRGHRRRTQDAHAAVSAAVEEHLTKHGYIPGRCRRTAP